jgi:hypothetical protein
MVASAVARGQMVVFLSPRTHLRMEVRREQGPAVVMVFPTWSMARNVTLAI